MKTVRFSQIVSKCGKPELHLVLVDPKKDRVLQAAVKARKVMTLRQNLKGTQTDRGVVGFDPGPSRQFLIFPRSLKSFEERPVVGIHYELFIEPGEAVKAVKARATKAASKTKGEAKTKARTRAEAPAKDKVLPFRHEDEEREEAEELVEVEEDLPEVAALKAQVRRAMRALKQGKQVAAFDMLQRIVGEE